jgi:hypothetical protein
LKRILARQPIFNAQRAVYGYELLYGSGVENFYDAVHADTASASAVVHLGVSEDVVPALYLESVDWAQQILSERSQGQLKSARVTPTLS